MTKQKELIMQALGEAAAIFTTQAIKGTEIVMPSEELIKIGENLNYNLDILKRHKN
jgi:hypothetical protein